MNTHFYTLKPKIIRNKINSSERYRSNCDGGGGSGGGGGGDWGGVGAFKS